MSKQVFKRLKYVNLFVRVPTESLSVRLRQFFLKFLHVHLEEPTGTVYYRNPVAVDIFGILLELATESLTDQEKYQEAAERYYLLGILSWRQWSLGWLPQKSRSGQISCIGEALAQWNKPFDTFLVTQALSRKLCDRPKLDSQLLNAQETWASLPHGWY